MSAYMHINTTYTSGVASFNKISFLTLVHRADCPARNCGWLRTSALGKQAEFNVLTIKIEMGCTRRETRQPPLVKERKMRFAFLDSRIDCVRCVRVWQA